MTCNRDKNSMKGKGVHSGIPLHVPCHCFCSKFSFSSNLLY